MNIRFPDLFQMAPTMTTPSSTPIQSPSHPLSLRDPLLFYVALLLYTVVPRRLSQLLAECGRSPRLCTTILSRLSFLGFVYGLKSSKPFVACKAQSESRSVRPHQILNCGFLRQ